MEFVTESKVDEERVGDIDIEDEEDDQEFGDWCEDDEDERVRSLFSDVMLPSVKELVTHDAQNFGFDLAQVVKDVCSDEISFIKLVNFIRKSRLVENPVLPTDLLETISTKAFLEDDENMKPVVADDTLLFLFEEAFVFSAEEEEVATRPPQSEEAIAATLDAIAQKEV